MNKSFYLLLILCLISCKNTSDPNILSQAFSHDEFTPTAKSDTLFVDLVASEVLWKGTKMRGAGQHQGRILLKDGFFHSEGKHITGGKFIVAMHTIEVTDIPKHEPVPKKRLEDHLKGPDFFNSSKYPISIFEITNVLSTAKGMLNIEGNLTIKDVTRSIQFTAILHEGTFSGTFSINRFDYNIGYTGSWLEKTLVDKQVEITIKITIRS